MVFLRFPSPITVGNPSFSLIVFPVKTTFIEHLEVDSYGFPMVFAFFWLKPPFIVDFPMIFPWFYHWNFHWSWIFPWFSHDFPMIYPSKPPFSHDFPIKTSIFPWFSHQNLHFPMIFPSKPPFSHGFPIKTPMSQVFPRAPRRDLRLGLDLGGRGGVAEAPGPRLCLGWMVLIMVNIWVCLKIGYIPNEIAI